jgi:hypothetical protein
VRVGYSEKSQGKDAVRVDVERHVDEWWYVVMRVEVVVVVVVVVVEGDELGLGN